MSQLTEYEQKAVNAFEKSIHEGKWSTGGLVSILKLLTDDYLNLKRVSSYSKLTGVTTQWVRKSSHPIKIDGMNFIIDNE